MKNLVELHAVRKTQMSSKDETIVVKQRSSGSKAKSIGTDDLGTFAPIHRRRRLRSARLFDMSLDLLSAAKHANARPRILRLTSANKVLNQGLLENIFRTIEASGESARSVNFFHTRANCHGKRIQKS